MNTVSKLLQKIYTARLDIFFSLFRCNFQCCCYDIVRLSSSCMSGLVVKQVFLRSFYKNILTSERLPYSCFNLVGTMANTPQKLSPNSIEPFSDGYYNSSSNLMDIPITFHLENVACETASQSVLESNTCVETSMALKDKIFADKQRYKGMRRWKHVKNEKLTSNSEEYFILRVLSFNILAQHLLETYSYLYKEHDKRALSWENRRQLLLQEILGSEANVICLQEMQEEHLPEFLNQFRAFGYNYLYKRRTNDKKDGLLFLYRSDQFILLDHANVELYQSGIELLSRDNVGIIAKLAVRENPEIQVVIATTHLLYNPKRNDVRLGQTQLLLAEIERIAFLKNTMTGPKYLPIIFMGDFNLEPYSGVYRFIIDGLFHYEGKGRNLERTDYHRSLSNFLIPPSLCVTDNCQHLNVLKYRLLGEGTNKVMLENSEHQTVENNISSNNSLNYCEVTTDSAQIQRMEIMNGYRVKFASGTLTHPFHFNSVYQHQNHKGDLEATTNQGRWITVDYIFYSDLKLIEKYSLPTCNECNKFPTIPNFAVGSDHLCLGATFKIPKRTP